MNGTVMVVAAGLQPVPPNWQPSARRGRLAHFPTSRLPDSPTRHRPVVREAEERDGAGDGGGIADRVTDPAALRQDVVRHRLALPHQFLADADGEGEIGEVIAV